MRKHKIDFKKYAKMHDIVELTGKDGTVVKVMTHIPYEDKVNLSRETIEQALMIHDDSICYSGYNTEAVKMKKVLEYYTDINVENATEEEVADFLINNHLWDQLAEIIEDDWDHTMDVYIRMLDGVIDSYKDDRGLTKAIRKSFGFLFNGEDIAESLAKAEAAKETVYKAIGALNDKEKEEQERVNNGRLMIGNNIISLAKKE